MMAPGLPEVATMYGISDPTVVALTLSVFLISFGIGVSVMITLSSSSPFESTDPLNNSLLFLHLYRKCMVGLG